MATRRRSYGHALPPMQTKLPFVQSRSGRALRPPSKHADEEDMAPAAVRTKPAPLPRPTRAKPAFPRQLCTDSYNERRRAKYKEAMAAKRAAKEQGSGNPAVADQPQPEEPPQLPQLEPELPQLEELDQAFTALEASICEVKRSGAWSMDEDEALKRAMRTRGARSWKWVANEIGCRSAKQARERWFNHLDEGLTHDPMKGEELQLLVDLVDRHGRHWSAIADQLTQWRSDRGLRGRRSDNSVKNVYTALHGRVAPTPRPTFKLPGKLKRMTVTVTINAPPPRPEKEGGFRSVVVPSVTAADKTNGAHKCVIGGLFHGNRFAAINQKLRSPMKPAKQKLVLAHALRQDAQSPCAELEGEMTADEVVEALQLV